MVNIIIPTLRNKEHELKYEFEDSKLSEGFKC